MTLADAARLAIQAKRKKEAAKQHIAEKKAKKEAVGDMSDSEEEDMQNRQLQTNAFKKVSR